ncbi:MAG: ion transporter, partial [Nitrososphaeraceae archaeon]
IMASLTLASVIVAVLLYVVPLSQSQITAIYIFDFIVVILLAADFYARMRKSKQGFRFIVRYWYEIPAMLPLFLFTVLETEPDIGGALRIFRLIRPFRLLRLLRLANLFRTIKYLKASGFIYFIIFSTVALVFGSIGIYVVEAGDPRSNKKYWRCILVFSDYDYNYRIRRCVSSYSRRKGDSSYTHFHRNRRDTGFYNPIWSYVSRSKVKDKSQTGR